MTVCKYCYTENAAGTSVCTACGRKIAPLSRDNAFGRKFLAGGAFLLIAGLLVGGYFLRKGFRTANGGSTNENHGEVKLPATAAEPPESARPDDNQPEVVPASAIQSPAAALVDQPAKPEIPSAAQPEKNEAPTAAGLVPKPRKRLAARAPDTEEIIKGETGTTVDAVSETIEAQYTASVWAAVLKELNQIAHPWIKPDRESYRIYLRVYIDSGQIELLRTSGNLGDELTGQLIAAVARCSGAVQIPKGMPREYGDFIDFNVHMTPESLNQVATKSAQGN